MVGLWRHECERVFCDKLVNNKDKDTVIDAIHKISIEKFGMENEINEQFARDKQFLFCDFLEDDERDPEQPTIIIKPSPMLYEACNDLDLLKSRGY